MHGRTTIKISDKVSRKATAGKREGMATEQLPQMPAVRTDRFNISGFVKFTAQGTVIKQNLQTTESNTNNIYRYRLHYTQYTTSIHSTQYTIHSTQYTIDSTLFHYAH
jgi:hypothetical protein